MGRLATTATSELIDFAEAPARFMTGGGRRVIRTSERYTLVADVGRMWAGVEAIRLRDDEVADAVAEVAAFREETRTEIASWWLTERSTPPALENLLLANGLARSDYDYLSAAMLLTEEPPPGPPDIIARPIENLDEYVAVRRVQIGAFETEQRRPKTDEELAEEYQHAVDVTFAAWVDGRVAGAARASLASCGVFLSGGATAQWARGRGAYRALVRARWGVAAARGTPALAVGAGPMSRPILERLGFRQVLQFRRLESVRPTA